MSRTWLLRGVAVAVFAVLIGAWAVDFARSDESPAPPENVVTNPDSPDESREPDGKRSTALEKKDKDRRAREGRTTPAVLREPSPDTATAPVDQDPSTPPPTSPDPTPDQPDPSNQPSNPPPPSHTPSPSNPPTQPDEECTDLADVIDCVLAPITDRP